MEAIIENLKQTYFLEIPLLGMLMYLLIKSIFENNVLHNGWAYFGMFAISLMLKFLSLGLQDDFLKQLDIFSAFLLTLLETSVFTFYLLSRLSSYWKNKQWLILLVLSILFSVVISYHNNKIFDLNINAYQILNLIEYSLLFILSLYYFIKTFKENRFLVLRENPNFWITTGIFFFSLINIPITAIEPFLFASNRKMYNLMYVEVYILYIILLGMIIKGISCRKRKMIF